MANPWNMEVVGGADEPKYESPFLTEMERFVKRNKDKASCVAYPQEWMDAQDRVIFGEVCENLIGDKSDKFLQTLFANFGNAYTNHPGDKRNRKSSDLLSFSSHASEFLRLNPGFLLDKVTTLSRYSKFVNNNDVVQDGGLDGVAHALGEPDSRSVDQRLYFFVFYSSNMTTRASIALRKVMVLSKSREEISSLEKKAGYRSIDEARKIKIKNSSNEGHKCIKPDKALLSIVLAALETVKDDTSPEKKDGLISKLMELICNDSEDIKCWVTYHMYNRARTSLGKEWRRKKKETSYSGDVGTLIGDNDPSLPSFLDAKSSFMVSSKRVDFRDDTPEEKTDRAEKVAAITKESLDYTKALGEYIVKTLRAKCKMKSMERAECLEAVIHLSLRQISELFVPENEQARKRVSEKGLCYRQKGSSIVIHYDGNRDLSKLISPTDLIKEIKEISQFKRFVHLLREKGIDIALIPEIVTKHEKYGEISKRLMVNKDFIDNILLQPLEVTRKLANLNFDAKTRRSIKNHFGHWWVEMLPIMLAVKEDHPAESRIDLLNILGVHQYIIGGVSWGWNVNRESGLSNTRMYFEAIGDPLSYNNPDHKDILERERMYIVSSLPKKK